MKHINFLSSLIVIPVKESWNSDLDYERRYKDASWVYKNIKYIKQRNPVEMKDKDSNI